MIESNLDQIEVLIEDEVTRYSEVIPGQLITLVREIQSSMKGGAPVDSGDLRRSIRVRLQDYDLSINMLEYGYYQSFGVNGRGQRGALGLPPEVAQSFGVREGYKFGSNRVWGIRPKRFYPMDIEETIFQILLRDNG